MITLLIIVSAETLHKIIQYITHFYFLESKWLDKQESLKTMKT